MNSTNKPPAPPGYPATPELDKMHKHVEISQKIGEFIEWLREEKKVGFFTVKEVQEIEDGQLFTQQIKKPFCENINELLAEYYGIDLNKVEEERSRILDYLMERHEDKTLPEIKITVTEVDDDGD